jgi:uncharacterized protein YoxC
MGGAVTTALPAWLQIVWAVTAILIAFGAIAWALLILWPYLRETRLVMRESLKLGRATTSTLTTLEGDIRPVVKDLKEIVSDIRTLISDVKEQKPGRIIEFLEKLQKDGSIEKIATSVEAIARKAHEAFEQGRVPKGTEITVPEFTPLPPCLKCGTSHHPIAVCHFIRPNWPSEDR